MEMTKNMKHTILTLTVLLLAPLAALPLLSHAADSLRPVIGRLDQVADN
jgi:hypothetical protein